MGNVCNVMYRSVVVFSQFLFLILGIMIGKRNRKLYCQVTNSTWPGIYFSVWQNIQIFTFMHLTHTFNAYHLDVKT